MSDAQFILFTLGTALTTIGIFAVGQWTVKPNKLANRLAIGVTCLTVGLALLIIRKMIS